jgi:serine/threonine-protein kinase
VQGRVIAGRYKLERELGAGAMGAVWLALDNGAEVAVKVVSQDIARNRAALARFEREAQLAERVRSDFVVRTLAHGRDDDGLPYIVMEYLRGESLRQRLERVGPLNPLETARVVTQVARALTVAHDVGLVHRDIKPENVFMTELDDGTEVAKVLDFGVAKATDVLAAEGIDPTKTGALLGTPHYMSPEQAQGLKSLDHRSDLWSLGIIAYECLSGHLPFYSASLGPLIAKIMQGPVPRLTDADAELPASLDTWLRRALARDPDRRFQHAAQVASTFAQAAGVVDELAAAPSASSCSGAVSSNGLRVDSWPGGTQIDGYGGTVALPSSKGSPSWAQTEVIPSSERPDTEQTSVEAAEPSAPQVVDPPPVSRGDGMETLASDVRTPMTKPGYGLWIAAALVVLVAGLAALLL